jgi:hypothetical protein
MEWTITFILSCATLTTVAKAALDSGLLVVHNGHREADLQPAWSRHWGLRGNNVLLYTVLQMRRSFLASGGESKRFACHCWVSRFQTSSLENLWQWNSKGILVSSLERGVRGYFFKHATFCSPLWGPPARKQIVVAIICRYYLKKLHFLSVVGKWTVCTVALRTGTQQAVNRDWVQVHRTVCSITYRHQHRPGICPLLSGKY